MEGVSVEHDLVPLITSDIGVMVRVFISHQLLPANEVKGR